MADNKECVKVAVRCRPLFGNEIQHGNKSIVNVIPDRGQIIVTINKDAGQKQRNFSFDLVFEPTCKQQKIFNQAALPIIQSVLEGYNGTIFAYGQTGTGKTHTMQGSKTVDEQRGIIPRTFQHVIKSIQGTPGVNFMVQVSMLQLYNEEIADLLSSDQTKKLQIHENKDKGLYVKDLTSYPVTTDEEMRRKLKQGTGNRHVGQTEMNKDSSRSHSIFIIRVEQQEEIKGESKIKAGRLNLVDLAGSERQKKTQATGSRSKEGIYINLSLSTLGQVIGSLTSQNPGHIPYRDSKLTRLLQQSLGGNAKTIMIANVGPADYNYEQTISTLRYASQAKRIKNKPKINEDPKDAMIREYQEEIERLKKQLQGKLPPDGIIVEKRVKVPSKREKQLKNRFNDEKNKMAEELDRQKNKANELKQQAQKVDQQRQNERKKQQDLALKLKEMKEKIVRGNKLKQETRIHDKKLFEAHQELEQRKQQQRRLAEQLNQKMVEVQSINQKNLSLKQQVEHRRKQLQKINNKLKIAYEQNNDIQEFMTQQRQELEEENRSLVRELKLVNMIIENFCPIQEVAAIQHRLEFDEGFDDWVIVEKNPRPKPNPGSAVGLRASLCAEGRMAVSCGDDNPRFRQENIIVMDLNHVESTIEDFKGYEISQNVLENLSVVLNENQEEQRMIAKQERPNVYIDDPQKMNKEQVMKQMESTTRAKSAKRMRPASGNKKKK